jgi:hypothetical protein
MPQDEVWVDYADTWLRGRVVVRYTFAGRCRAVVVIRTADGTSRVQARWCDELTESRPGRAGATIIAPLVKAIVGDSGRAPR